MLSHLFDETIEQLNDHDYSKIGQTVDELLSAHGLTVSKTSLAYKRLCRSILEAQQQALRIEVGRLDGDYTRKGNIHRAGVSSNAAGATPYVPSVFAPTPNITEAFKLYIEHYSHRDKRTTKRRGEYFNGALNFYLPREPLC
jgi:hypothetical protein